METRNILDYQGQIIGQIDMPIGTSENLWAHALAPYAVAPVKRTLQDIISNKIVTAQDFGAQIVLQAKISNVALGVTQAGMTKQASDYLQDVAHYLTEGSLYAAVVAFDSLIAAPIPTELQPFISVDRLSANKNQVQDFLGLPRT